MEIDSVNRSSRIVNLAPSHEEGGFIGDVAEVSSAQRAVGGGIELHITNPESFDDFDAMETGDKEVLSKYLMPDEDRPGHFTFAQGCYAWFSNAHCSVRSVDGIIEYAPFAEKTEHLEVA